MKKILIPALLLLAAMPSCKKKADTGTPVPVNNFKMYTSMDTIFTMLSLQPKAVTIDAGRDTSFYGNSGTRYIFMKNSFRYANGDTVTGNVQVEVTEYLKKGDMIFSGVLPVSNGAPLISGGEINIKASKAGQEIFLRPGYPFQANIPQFGSTDTVMSLFRGITGTGIDNSKVNWQMRLDTGKYWKAPYFNDTFSILSDSLNYWNCDHFLGGTDLQSFSVSINSAATISATPYSYVLFDNYNGVTVLSSSTGNVYSVTNIPRTPVHVISFVLINGHFYGGVTSTSLATTGQNLAITLTEVDPADFKAQINGLYSIVH